MQGDNAYKSGNKVADASATNHAHKYAVKVDDIIEIENEFGLFKVIKVSATNQITAQNYEGFRLVIPRSEVRYNHKNTVEL